MIPNSYFVVFVVSLSALYVNCKPANLVAIACQRNPSLAMCGTSSGNTDNVEFRAADVSFSLSYLLILILILLFFTGSRRY